MVERVQRGGRPAYKPENGGRAVPYEAGNARDRQRAKRLAQQRERRIRKRERRTRHHGQSRESGS